MPGAVADLMLAQATPDEPGGRAGRARRRRSALRFLGGCMVALGVAIGLVFPAFMQAMGIATPEQAWSVRSRVACLTAGILVGGINYVFVRLVVSGRLRRLTRQMRRVDEVVRTATATGDWSALDVAACQLPVDSDDELGETALAFNALVSALNHNVVERRELESTLHHRAAHDALTGLPNRTLFVDLCDQALSADARTGTSTGLLVIDLDRFKEVNDTFGHEYGDELLTQVGLRLTGALRDVDTVARLGGDEFAVLLPGVAGVDGARGVAITLQAALETPFRVEGIELDVEASVGFAVSGEHGQDATTLLRHADFAMYVAKGNTLGVAAYDPTVDGHAPARLTLLGDLRRALDRDELVLHYQPKLSIRTGDVVGAEALVRWQHPERGLVFPDDFIPLAEHTGLIAPLTRHVLDTALAQARSWSDAGRPLTISVNLSVRNLLDESLPGQVAELLAAHGVAPEMLALEVTETAIMTEPARAQRVLEQLTALGVTISIDDFGVGYTSLGQLKNLPVSELKIDRSFVMAMSEDPSNALIVHSVVGLGHNLGLTLVAEGVETEEALTALAALGCDVAQGYLLSRPVTAAAFDLWCTGRRIAPARRASGVARLPGLPHPGLPRRRAVAVTAVAATDGGAAATT